MKKMFFVIVMMIVAFVVSISCSNEPINENISNSSTSMTTVIENLDIYSNEYAKNNYKILEALGRNKKLEFNAGFLNALLHTKNGNDLKILFQNAGIDNSIEVLGLLKKSIQIQSDFRKVNPIFYKLDIQKRTELLEKSFEVVLKRIDLSNSIGYMAQRGVTSGFVNYMPFEAAPLIPTDLVGANCYSIYVKERKRCERDFFVCGGFALASALYTVGWGTVVGAAYCSVTLNICGMDAQEDYSDCLKPYEEYPWLPADMEVPQK